MQRISRLASPSPALGAPAVRKEDVGHVDLPVGRNDGPVKRPSLRPTKEKHESNKKNDTGEVCAGTSSGEENEDEDEDDEVVDGDDEDEEATDSDAEELENTPSSDDFNDPRNFGGPTAAAFNVGRGLKRKRTASDLSANIVVSTIEGDDTEREFPRKRANRRLSNSEKGLLKYESGEVNTDDEIDMAEYTNAIADSSDEEDAVYDGMPTIDDEDDSDVEQAEEDMIIQEETERQGRQGSYMPLLLGGGFDSDLDLPDQVDFAFPTSEAEDLMGHTESFFSRSIEGDLDRPARKKSDASARRVRFQDEIDVQHAYNSTTSSDTDIDIFPDLLDNPFKSADDLPVSLRQRLDEEDDVALGAGLSSDGEGSVWDFGEEKASENFFAWHDGAGSDSNGEASGTDLSGYDSDGDTTDDDMPPPSTIRTPRTLLHSCSPSTITSSVVTPKEFPRSRRARRGPVMGSFIVDQKKAMAFIDPNTRQLRIQPARNPMRDAFNSTASSVDNSPHMSFHSLAFERDTGEFQRLLTGPTDVMMSGVFGGLPGQCYENGRFVMESNEPLLIGPPEAFYPFTSIGTDGTPDEDDEFGSDEEFEDDTDVFTMFMEMEEVDEDEDDGPGFVEEDADVTSATSDAAEMTPSVRNPSKLLNHLNSGVVNAFRKNQETHRHKAKLSYHHDPNSTPIRSGKSAEEVITPLRKRKSGAMTKPKAMPRRMPVMGSFA